MRLIEELASAVEFDLDLEDPLMEIDEVGEFTIDEGRGEVLATGETDGNSLELAMEEELALFFRSFFVITARPLSGTGPADPFCRANRSSFAFPAIRIPMPVPAADTSETAVVPGEEYGEEATDEGDFGLMVGEEAALMLTIDVDALVDSDGDVLAETTLLLRVRESGVDGVDVDPAASFSAVSAGSCRILPTASCAAARRRSEADGTAATRGAGIGCKGAFMLTVAGME